MKNLYSLTEAAEDEETVADIRLKLKELEKRKKDREALEKGIELLGHPGAKEAGKSHAGGTSFGIAGAAADFASDDQGTNIA